MSSAADFWTRRRAAVAAEARLEERGRVLARQDAAAPEAAQKTDEELLEEFGLPDPDHLEAGDDFAAFMKAAVPERLRRRALRRLWLSNPVLANLDGLVDYGEDYSAAADAGQSLRTAYQVGKGMAAHLNALAEQAERTEAQGTAEDEIEDPVGAGSVQTELCSAEDAAPAPVADARTQRRMRFLFAEDAVSGQSGLSEG